MLNVSALYLRYHIHQYNADTLIMATLPYHDNSVFVKLLQLMKPALAPPTSKWHWMSPSMVSKVNYVTSHLFGSINGTICDHKVDCPFY